MRDMVCMTKSFWYVAITLLEVAWATVVLLPLLMEGRLLVLTHITVNTGQGRNPCVNDLTTILLLTDGTELTSLVCYLLGTD